MNKIESPIKQQYIVVRRRHRHPMSLDLDNANPKFIHEVIWEGESASMAEAANTALKKMDEGRCVTSKIVEWLVEVREKDDCLLIVFCAERSKKLFAAQYTEKLKPHIKVVPHAERDSLLRQRKEIDEKLAAYENAITD